MITIGICTMDRPQWLERALKSIKNSTIPPAEIIVSDDSRQNFNQVLTQKLAEMYEAKYIKGPNKGLSANRNNILRYVKTPFVCFIDDDVELDSHFLEKAINFYKEIKEEKIILTGYEIQNGKPVTPVNLSFLGFYQEEVKGDMKSICINSTVFPTICFEYALFDENIFYGTEEREMALKLWKKGFKIVYHPELFNYHFPSPVNREKYSQHLLFSYFYFGLKRYFFFETSFSKFIIFNIYAPLRFAGGRLFRGDIMNLLRIPLAFIKSWIAFFPFLLKLKDPFNLQKL